MHDYCAGCCFKTGASNNCPVHNQEYIRAEKELRADNRTHGFVDVDDDGNVDDHYQKGNGKIESSELHSLSFRL